MQSIQPVQEMHLTEDFLQHFPKEKELWEAVRFANGLAALSVQRLETTPAMPTREEIDKFLAEHE